MVWPEPDVIWWKMSNAFDPYGLARSVREGVCARRHRRFRGRENHVMFTVIPCDNVIGRYGSVTRWRSQMCSTPCESVARRAQGKFVRLGTAPTSTRVALLVSSDGLLQSPHHGQEDPEGLHSG
jgi:hypothetical protein